MKILCLLLLGFSNVIFAKDLTTNELNDCKLKIVEKLYYSKSAQAAVDNQAEKISNPDYVKNLEDIFAYLPEIQKKIFCHVTRIQIHKELPSWGYANVIFDEDKRPIGSLIGIKVQAFSPSKDLDVFSWKEQLSFGLSKLKDPHFTINPAGPRVKLKIEKVKNPELFYMMVHEINHLVDFMNNIVRFRCTNSRLFGEETYDCQFAPNSFSNLSYFNFFNANSRGQLFLNFEEKTPLLSKFCFYECEEFMDASDMESVYQDLAQTNFVSAYSMTTMYEDFADFATVYLLHTLNLKYELKIYNENNEVIYDQNKHFFDPLNQKMRIKRQWMQNFFTLNSLKYQ